MAFDMYIDNERAFIDHHEEELFFLIKDNGRFPRLNWIWEEFYAGPVIEPNIANELLHELIATKELVPKDKKHLVYVIDRLLPFLSKSFTTSTAIRCVSD